MTSTPRDRDDDGGVDVEAAWADIVAHWDTDGPPVGPWPASEDADDSGEDPDDAQAPDDGTVEEWDGVASHVGGEAARHAAAAPEPEDEEEGFVPPEPPPLPRGDLVTTLSWAGVLGSPLFFLLTALFWRSVPQVLILLAIGAFVAGFVSLVLRMPSRRDPDDDDGAVV
ncbi:MAG: hypothetical protein ACOYXW_03930 [Actinomycetota bacterium]